MTVMKASVFAVHRAIKQSRTFSGRHRSVLCCSIKDYRGKLPVDPNKHIVVRFVPKGLMFAGFAPGRSPDRSRGRQPAPRAQAPVSMCGMMANLTAIEQTNRAQALSASRHR